MSEKFHGASARKDGNGGTDMKFYRLSPLGKFQFGEDSKYEKGCSTSQLYEMPGGVVHQV